MHRILIKPIEKEQQCGRTKQKTKKTHEKKEDGKDVDDDDGDEEAEAAAAEEEEGAVATCSGSTRNSIANEFWFQQDLCVE